MKARNQPLHAARISQVAAEAYIIDFLRKANAVALHSRRQTVAAHDLQFLRMINGPNAWSAEPQRSRCEASPLQGCVGGIVVRGVSWFSST